jgi:hypothetical protein
VTRYKSGGVAGTEKDGLNGVGGLVCGREFVPPIKVSWFCLAPGDESGGAAIATFCVVSLEGV